MTMPTFSAKAHEGWDARGSCDRVDEDHDVPVASSSAQPRAAFALAVIHTTCARAAIRASGPSVAVNDQHLVTAQPDGVDISPTVLPPALGTTTVTRLVGIRKMGTGVFFVGGPGAKDSRPLFLQEDAADAARPAL